MVGSEAWPLYIKLNPPERKPTTLEEAKMLGLMFACSVRTTMMHHMFTYKGATHHQKDGAPMSVRVSVAVARAMMLDWDIQFLDLTNISGISVLALGLGGERRHLCWNLWIGPAGEGGE